MRVTVLFFGILKDIVGASVEQIEIEEGARLGSLFDAYATRIPHLQEFRSSTVLARNQQFAGADSLLEDGDEIAFLPPVSGGIGAYTHEILDTARGNFFALTREAIDTVATGRRLLRGSDGALIHFEGVVRDNSGGRQTRFLDYECYESMAIKVMAEIGGAIASEFAIGRIALVHRLGRLDIGETSVLVAVTSPHRKAAFDAALEGINRLKRLVPIWKKEHFTDGEVWIEGEWDASVLGR